MAAVPVTFQGILFFSDIGVGGGPMPGGPGVSHPIAPGGPPPGIWPSPGYPAHPIAPGGQPPQIWPSPGRPDHSLPVPPQIWPSPGHPDQGLPPSGVGIWPSPGRPDHSLPGQQPGIWPSPPEGQGPGIWPGPGFGNQPTHPIVIPGDELPPGPVGPDKIVLVVYVPGVGYKMVVAPKPPGYNPPPGASTPNPQEEK